MGISNTPLEYPLFSVLSGTKPGVVTGTTSERLLVRRMQMEAGIGGNEMSKPKPASLALLLIGFSALAPVALSFPQTPASQKKGSEGKKKAVPQASLSGCIDQQEGRYVLIDDRTMNPVADLDADGFPTEGFAKHMGHKVTLRGISNPGSTRPAFKVRSIETISESCAATTPSDKK